MLELNYFSKFKRDDLQKEFEKIVSEGNIPVKEAAIAVINKEHKKLHEALNDLKGRTGIVKDQYEEPGPTEDEVIQMFNSCGDMRSDYHIIKSKKVKYAADEEAEFYRLAFKTGTVTVTEASILDLISKDKMITPEVIAKTLGTTKEYVTAKIARLVDKGWLKSSEIKIGEDKQIERTLEKPISDLPPTTEPETTEISVKYSYEGPKDERNRPFCAKLLELDRIYSRAEIERISDRLGYSVWDRRGGWWTMPNGEHSPSCRHRWESHIVVKKTKGKS